MAEENRFKTGEEAPESGKYKFDGFTEGDSSDANLSENEKVLDMEKGDRFPLLPSDNKGAYYVKA